MRKLLQDQSNIKSVDQNSNSTQDYLDFEDNSQGYEDHSNGEGKMSENPGDRNDSNEGASILDNHEEIMKPSYMEPPPTPSPEKSFIVRANHFC